MEDLLDFPIGSKRSSFELPPVSYYSCSAGLRRALNTTTKRHRIPGQCLDCFQKYRLVSHRHSTKTLNSCSAAQPSIRHNTNHHEDFPLSQRFVPRRSTNKRHMWNDSAFTSLEIGTASRKIKGAALAQRQRERERRRWVTVLSLLAAESCPPVCLFF